MVTDLGLKVLFENAAVSKDARDKKGSQGAEADEDIGKGCGEYVTEHRALIILIVPSKLHP